MYQKFQMSLYFSLMGAQRSSGAGRIFLMERDVKQIGGTWRKYRQCTEKKSIKDSK